MLRFCMAAFLSKHSRTAGLEKSVRVSEEFVSITYVRGGPCFIGYQSRDLQPFIPGKIEVSVTFFTPPQWVHFKLVYVCVCIPSRTNSIIE